MKGLRRASSDSKPVKVPMETRTDSSSDLRSRTMFVTLDGASIEVAFHEHAKGQNTLLMLHEALGSVSYWKRFPEQLAVATGVNVLLYSRSGHGLSNGPLAPRSPGSYNHEVDFVIPNILAHLRIENPILYGHSEGAAIALLYAARTPGVHSLVLESPFLVAPMFQGSLIEQMAATYAGGALQRLLGRYHQDCDKVFHSWVEWASMLSEGSSPLGLVLPKLHLPVLAMQGSGDGFGTCVHLKRLRAIAPNLQHEVFMGAGHLLHREQTERVLKVVSQFLSGVGLTEDSSLSPASADTQLVPRQQCSADRQSN